MKNVTTYSKRFIILEAISAAITSIINETSFRQSQIKKNFIISLESWGKAAGQSMRR